jgi:hypothetical protein
MEEQPIDPLTKLQRKVLVALLELEEAAGEDHVYGPPFTRDQISKHLDDGTTVESVRRVMRKLSAVGSEKRLHLLLDFAIPAAVNYLTHCYMVSLKFKEVYEELCDRKVALRHFRLLSEELAACDGEGETREEIAEFFLGEMESNANYVLRHRNGGANSGDDVSKRELRAAEIWYGLTEGQQKIVAAKVAEQYPEG